jgi:hypothetical protein
MNRFFLDRALVTEPTIPLQTSQEIERHFILRQHILETVTDLAGLCVKMFEISNSIPLSHINNFCRRLKPRIWTMEDLKGNTITGENDSNL